MSTAPGRSTRERILDAAIGLFAERGPEITLEAIAAEAAVSRQTVYVHFGSRTGLILALVQHLDTHGPLPDLIEQVVQAPDALAALDAVVRLHAEYSPVAYPVARVFMTTRHLDPALEVAWEDRMQARRGLYQEVADRLARDNLLAAPWTTESATEVVFAMTSWQLWEQLVVDGGWSQDDYRSRLQAMLRRVLVNAELGDTG
jgi:AcrR family transcriptional regulator